MNSLLLDNQSSLIQFTMISLQLKTRMTRQPGNAIPLCNVNELGKQIPPLATRILRHDHLSIHSRSLCQLMH